jgi:hypothetical protein
LAAAVANECCGVATVEEQVPCGDGTVESAAWVCGACRVVALAH